MWQCNYEIPPYSAELYHYGVKGMKWGVRKDSTGSPKKVKLWSEEYYRQKADKSLSDFNSRKTLAGKSLANVTATKHEYEANMKDMASKPGTSLGKKFDNTYGFGRDAVRSQAEAEYYSRIAPYAKTKLGRKIAERNAYNAQTKAEVQQRLHDSNTPIGIGANYVDGVLNRKVKTWSGRETTNAKRFVRGIFTAGLADPIMDVAYYVTH